MAIFNNNEKAWNSGTSPISLIENRGEVWRDRFDALEIRLLN
jgi:hypothetical protein